MKFIGIIPARYASTRFPGKPLVDIQGKTMIQRVYEQAMKAPSLSQVVVATDDKRIFDHVATFGQVVYTSADHPSGTDRCYEAATSMAGTLGTEPHDVIVNIQGDEPFIQPGQIELLCEAFRSPGVDIATLVRAIESDQELFGENTVKVVRNALGYALYFSRNPVPFVRGFPREQWLQKQTFFKHIGMYAYRYQVLGQITRLPQSELEKAESLEQLRWLENGYPVFTRQTQIEAIAIDTPEDLQKLSSPPANPL
ncbi:MAG: 3-deoxy-manno-octulosonate cytidylyltransferase [Bacteroidales bacterium]